VAEEERDDDDAARGDRQHQQEGVRIAREQPRGQTREEEGAETERGERETGGGAAVARPVERRSEPSASPLSVGQERGSFQAAITLNFSVWRNGWVWLLAGRIRVALFLFLFYLFFQPTIREQIPSTQWSHPRKRCLVDKLPHSTATLCTSLVHSAFVYSPARLTIRSCARRSLLGNPSVARLLLVARLEYLSVRYLEPCRPGLVLTRCSPIFCCFHFLLATTCRHVELTCYYIL
jgi:hypothetical protein